MNLFHVIDPQCPTPLKITGYSCGPLQRWTSFLQIYFIAVLPSLPLSHAHWPAAD